MTKVLIRHFAGRTPDGYEHLMVLTAGIGTPPEALEIADKIGIQALEHKIPGIRNVHTLGDHWAEHVIPDSDQYERRGWRKIRAGDVIKDPRGNRVIEHADKWGYRLMPDARHPFQFVRPWPTVGRLKVIT